MFNLFKRKKINHKLNKNNLEKKDAKNKSFLDKNSKNIIKFLLWILAIIFTTMSFVRVPFVGAFFDSTIFSILFGYTKYIAYFLIYFYLVMCLFPNLKSKIFTFRNLFIISIIWLSISIIVSSILVIVNYNTLQGSSLTFDQYFVGTSNSYFNYWRDNDWKNVMSSNWFYANPKGYGGILSFTIVILFEAVSPIILVIIMVALIVFVISFVFKKHKIINYSKSNSNGAIISKWNSLKMESMSTKKYIYVKKYFDYISNKKYKLPIKSINSLSDSSEDYYEDIKDKSEKTSKKIASFMKSLKINYQLKSQSLLFNSVIWKYEFKSKKDLKIIRENLEKLKTTLIANEISLYFSNNDLIISEKMNFRPIISLKESLTKIGTENYYNYVIGKLEDRNLISINGLLEPNLITFGTKGSGLSMFVSNLILSLAALNNKDLLDISINDTSSKTLKSLSILPQVSSYASDQNGISDNLDKIIQIIKNRKELIDKYKCKDIYNYYLKNSKSDLKINLLVLHGLEELMVWNKDGFINKIKFILENSFSTGVMVAISCNVVNNETIDLNNLFNNIVVFKLENEDDSIDIINNPSAYYLWGNGDGIIKSNNKLYHFQAIFVNKQETTSIIDMIKNNSINMEE